MTFQLSKVVKLRGAADGEWINCPLVSVSEFDVKVAYIEPDAWTKILSACRKPGKEEIDNDKLAKKIADEMIRDWRGLNGAALQELFPGMEQDQINEIPESGVPATNDAKFTLASQHREFYQWINKLSSDRAAFVAAKKQAEVKNS